MMHETVKSVPPIRNIHPKADLIFISGFWRKKLTMAPAPIDAIPPTSTWVPRSLPWRSSSTVFAITSVQGGTTKPSAIQIAQ